MQDIMITIEKNGLADVENTISLSSEIISIARNKTRKKHLLKKLKVIFLVNKNIKANSWFS